MTFCLRTCLESGGMQKIASDAHCNVANEVKVVAVQPAMQIPISKRVTRTERNLRTGPQEVGQIDAATI
jgi:hypothetical protein